MGESPSPPADKTEAVHPRRRSKQLTYPAFSARARRASLWRCLLRFPWRIILFPGSTGRQSAPDWLAATPRLAKPRSGALRILRLPFSQSSKPAAIRSRRLATSGSKSSAAPLTQYRNPVGSGPSGKTWPRCAEQRAHRTSVRRANHELSSCSETAEVSAGRQKLGQPLPDSNLASDSNNNSPQHTQW
jgi:hypothetical protein